MARIAVLGTVVAPVIEAGQIVGPEVIMGATATATLSAHSLYLEFDTTLIPDTDTLVLALNTALNYFQTTGSIVAD